MAAIAKLKLLASRKAADRPSAAAAPAAAAADEDDLPVPSDIKTVYLGGLFLLAMLAACYVAAEIFLPIVLAFVLSLVLQPAMRVFERVYLPRGIAALLVIMLLFGTLGGLGAALSGPAANWAQKLPTGVPKLEERLSFLSRPIAAFQKFAEQAQGLTQGGEAKAVPVAVQGSGLSERLLSGTRSLASGLLETVLVLFFLLVSGDTFLQAARRNPAAVQEQATGGRHLPADRERCIGLSVYDYDDEFGRRRGDRHGHGALRSGRPPAVGNGRLPAQLIPILGPMIGVVIFLLAGLLSINSLWAAFLPAGLYLLIHLIEGETVTPMLLARRFTINPVLVILSLVFWYWMWGVPGAILSTPMLAITKIICDRIRPLMAFGHFMEG